MNRWLFGAAAVAIALIAALHPVTRPAVVSLAPSPVSEPIKRGRASPRVPPAIVVYVVGAVAHRGLYRLGAQARASEAVRLAGGFTADADPQGVNLAERLEDGEEVVVPRVGEAAPLSHSPKHTRHRKRKRSFSLPAQSVDLNRANAAALATLPGIGQTLAQRIVAYRSLNGPFANTDELLDVAGMTQRRLDAVTPYVSVGAP